MNPTNLFRIFVKYAMFVNGAYKAPTSELTIEEARSVYQDHNEDRIVFEGFATQRVADYIQGKVATLVDAPVDVVPVTPTPIIEEIPVVEAPAILPVEPTPVVEARVEETTKSKK
jgi:hypothetical protein